ncbi:MAG: hypothetical protein HYX86_00250 [Chloroflexi bacterium]|nr:hypothetical protein [Chloroflexota bacterium]
MTENASDYIFLEIDSALAPDHAVRARIIAYANVQEPSPEMPVFFDDLAFSLVSAPPTPTPTPTPTATPTPVSWPKVLLN